MFGNASQDGIPPDGATAGGGDFEKSLGAGVKALEAELAAALTAAPLEGEDMEGPMMEGADMPDPMAQMMGDQGGMPEEPESEDAVQTKVVASLADSVRQSSEANTAALQQVADAMATMAQAMQKLGGPRTVRRSKDGKIEGVD
jgi:uncharacterized protein YdbL (DUF1318 family)